MARLNERGGRRNPLLQAPRAAQVKAVVREDEPTLIRVTGGGDDRHWYLRVKLSAKTAAELCRDEATAREAMVWHGGGWSPVLQVPELSKAISAHRKDTTRSGVTAASPARLAVAPAPGLQRFETMHASAPAGRRGWQPKLLPAPPAEALPASPSSRPPPPPLAVAAGALRAAGEAAALLPPAAPSAAPPAIPPAAKLPNLQPPSGHRSNGVRANTHQEVTTSDVHSLAPIQRSLSAEPASSPWMARVGYMMTGALLVSGVFWLAGLRSALPEASAPGAGVAEPTVTAAARPSARAPEASDIPMVALSALPALPQGVAAPTTVSSADDDDSKTDDTDSKAADGEPAEAEAGVQDKAPRAKARSARASKSRRASAAKSTKARAKATPSRDKPEPPEDTSRSRAEPSDTSGSSFNASAARLALRSAASRAGSCANGKASGTAVVTFAPWGGVTSVSVTNLEGANVRPGCVTRIFRSARVPPFSGDAVTVSKSFRVR